MPEVEQDKSNLNEQLFSNVRSDNLDSALASAKDAIEKGVDVNAKDEDGFTLLHSAAIAGYLDVVEFLIRACPQTSKFKHIPSLTSIYS